MAAMAEALLPCVGCDGRFPRSALQPRPQGEACPKCGALVLVNPKGKWKRSIPAPKWVKIEGLLARRAYAMASSFVAQEADCSLVQADEVLIPIIGKREREKKPPDAKAQALVKKLHAAFKAEDYNKIVVAAAEHEEDPPDDIAYDRVVAAALECMGQRRRAVAFYRNAYLREPKNADSLAPLAELLIRLGHTGQAKRYILEMKRAVPDDPRVPALTEMLNDQIATDHGETDEDEAPKKPESGRLQLGIDIEGWRKDLGTHPREEKPAPAPGKVGAAPPPPQRFDDSNMELDIPDDPDPGPGPAPRRPGRRDAEPGGHNMGMGV